MVTIKDISKASGFSITTVSKALNNYPDISIATREKILALCDELGYIPNSSARSLKTLRSYTIGVVYEEITNQGLQHPLFSRILERFRYVLEEKGYDIMFLARSTGNQNGSYLAHSRRKQVEGVLVLCADFNDPKLVELYESDIPAVTVDFAVPSAINITSDNAGGVRQAVNHLIGLGHERIAHIHGDRTSFIGGGRKYHFEKALKEKDLPVREEYLVDGPFFSREDGYSAMRRLLALRKVPTAVFCASDLLALGAIEAIRETKLKVPKDISVVGFDGIEIGQHVTPRLTTICQDTVSMGEKAAESLLELIKEPEKTNLGKTLTVDTEFLAGGTTAKAGGNR